MGKRTQYIPGNLTKVEDGIFYALLKQSFLPIYVFLAEVSSRAQRKNRASASSTSGLC